MMSRHYAPRTKLLLTDGQEDALAEKAREISKQKFGVLLPRGWKISAGATFDWGEWRDWAELASRLYAALRWLDEQNLNVIIAPLPPQEGLGGAIRERLLKAAGRETDDSELRTG